MGKRARSTVLQGTFVELSNLSKASWELVACDRIRGPHEEAHLNARSPKGLHHDFHIASRGKELDECVTCKTDTCGSRWEIVANRRHSSSHTT